MEIPPVARAIAMQLCPQGATAWRGNPRLPSRACKFSSALTAKAYSAAGQAASALHAMALLQVHQAKALKQLHEVGADPGVLQELRTATDLALRATKVTARALGQTMSTLVVQERHLWLTLADMRESDKHRFLDSPISQAGLFGEAVEDFSHQFSAAQKQTEAFRHILPWRSAAVSTPLPAAAPPSARHLGRPPAASTSAPARPQQQPSQRPQRRAGRWKVASLRRATRSLWILLPRRRAGWRIFCFLFVLFRGPVVTKTSKKSSFLFLRVPAMEPGECRTTHSDPTSRRTAFRVGPLCSTSLPHRGYVGNSPGPACTVPGLVVARWLLRTIRLGYAIQFARRPPKFRGIQFTSVLNKDAPVLRAEVAVLLAKDVIEPVPPAEMKSGFYSPYFIVPKKGSGLRPILYLRVLN